MLDFRFAKLQHCLWTMKMNHFVNARDSTVRDISLISHQDCQLGKWLESQEVSEFLSLCPEIPELQQSHQELHNISQKIIHLNQKGQIKEALKQLFLLQSISDTVINLLDRIEQQVKTMVH